MTTTITAYRERPITRPFMGPMRADDARRVGSMTKNEVIQRFEDALLADKIRTVIKCLPLIDRHFCWPQAMRRVVSIKQDLNQLLQYRLYHTWCHHGDHIRQSVNNDILLIDALRKLLPPYRGGDKLLYRGESAENYKRGTYGLSWTPIKSVAVGFAGGDPLHKIARCTKGGTVLLRARVPQAAIIAKMQKSYDYYQEQEYLVDRRFLKGVFAAKSFPEYTGKLTAVVPFPSANDVKRARAILRRKAAA